MKADKKFLKKEELKSLIPSCLYIGTFHLLLSMLFTFVQMDWFWLCLEHNRKPPRIKCIHAIEKVQVERKKKKFSRFEILCLFVNYVTFNEIYLHLFSRCCYSIRACSQSICNLLKFSRSLKIIPTYVSHSQSIFVFPSN